MPLAKLHWCAASQSRLPLSPSAALLHSSMGRRVCHKQCAFAPHLLRCYAPALPHSLSHCPSLLAVPTCPPAAPWVLLPHGFLPSYPYADLYRETVQASVLARRKALQADQQQVQFVQQVHTALESKQPARAQRAEAEAQQVRKGATAGRLAAFSFTGLLAGFPG